MTAIKMIQFDNTDENLDIHIFLPSKWEVMESLDPDLIDYLEYNDVVSSLSEINFFIKRQITESIINKKGYKYDENNL